MSACAKLGRGMASGPACACRKSVEMKKNFFFFFLMAEVKLLVGKDL